MPGVSLRVMAFLFVFTWAVRNLQASVNCIIIWHRRASQSLLAQAYFWKSRLKYKWHWMFLPSYIKKCFAVVRVFTLSNKFLFLFFVLRQVSCLSALSLSPSRLLLWVETLRRLQTSQLYQNVDSSQSQVSTCTWGKTRENWNQDMIGFAFTSDWMTDDRVEVKRADLRPMYYSPCTALKFA